MQDKHAYTHSMFYRTLNHDLQQSTREWSSNLGHPLVLNHKSTCFHAYRKTNPSSLQSYKIEYNRVASMQQRHKYPHTRLQALTRLKTSIRSLTAPTGVFGSLTSEINIYLCSRANPIPIPYLQILTDILSCYP